jgi:LysM repeat protein
MFGRPALFRLTLTCAALAPLLAAPAAFAQATVADLNEDVRGLSQHVNELSLRVEQLEHDNEVLRSKVSALDGAKDSVTTAQLNGAVADLNASIQSAVAASRTEILDKVATQMEKLAKQTNAALDSIAKPVEAPAPVATTIPVSKAQFSETYPKEGLSYTVAKGDSLGGIAHKTKSKAQDIIAANKLTDPSKIQLGQVLFIPGGKEPQTP